MNDKGQLGTGNTNYAGTPIAISGSGRVWSSLVAGYAHTLAIERNSSRLYAFGANYNGQVVWNICSGDPVRHAYSGLLRLNQLAKLLCALLR
jgi:hypothetical protein